MSDLFGAAGVDAAHVVDLPTQIAEARRELDMRRRVYARHVEAGKMTQTAADKFIRLQEAIIATLEGGNAAGITSDVGLQRQAAAVERAAANWRGHVNNLAALAARGKRPQSECDMAAVWAPDLEAAAVTMRALANGTYKP